ncbi:MAG TPA: thioesterase family protein [Caulobacter sp.]|nr:thioesterase family protein [Caulobacter sp.]
MTTSHPLDQATTLVPTGERRATGATHPAFAIMAGPFGGATAATLLRAVLEDPACIGEPIALTVNFTGAIADGEFEVSWIEKRTGRTVQHWTVDLVQNGKVAATASVVCGRRTEAWTHRPATMPVAPPAADVAPLDMGTRLGWIQRYAFRFVEGAPGFGEPPADGPRSAKTTCWLSDLPERTLDFLSLAALSDAFIVRIIQVRGKPGPMGTITLTTYFHAGAEALAANGARPILGVADASVFHGGFADQQASLWRDDGVLLATSVQQSFYRD